MSTDSLQPGPGQHTAQDLVKEIAKERGYLGEEQLARIGEINPELRREVEEALLRKDEMIGSAVLTYALTLSQTQGFIDDIPGWHEIFTQAMLDLSSSCSRMRTTITTARRSQAVKIRLCLSKFAQIRCRLSAMRTASRMRTSRPFVQSARVPKSGQLGTLARRALASSLYLWRLGRFAFSQTTFRSRSHIARGIPVSAWLHQYGRMQMSH